MPLHDKDLDKDLIEEKIGSEQVFDGNLLKVYRDTVKLPTGNEATREWIKHPGASAVLPVLADGQVILVKQYRYPIGRVTLEIPAGKLDAPDEDPQLCAVRELSEETGYTAEKIEKLTTIATTVGFSNEYIHIYAATGLKAGQQHTDEDEFINVVKMPLAKAVEMVLSGEIYDCKSVAAILLVERMLKK
ncbi:MAG: NUDIX hydrolase [Selenomonas sp.]|nr:NUDIX hydrolase [Selenomonas sp.]